MSMLIHRRPLLMQCAFLLMAANWAIADVWLSVDGQGVRGIKEPSAAAAPQLVVTRSDETGLALTFELTGIRAKELKTARGAFVTLDWPDSSVAGDVGAPAIPVLRRLIVAPEGARVTTSITTGSAVALDSTAVGAVLRLVPVQPPIPKLPGAVQQAAFVLDENAYAADAQLPAERVRLEELGSMNGRRLLLIEIRPLAYNAAAQTAAFWPIIKVDVRFEGGAASTPARDAPGLHDVVLNPGLLGVATRATGNYLIIAGNPYGAAIAPLAAAKSAQGFAVSTWTAPVGATGTQIKAQIQTRWADPGTAPDYVLLVGDTDTIPHWVGQGEGTPSTDLPYVCMDGASDWMPDIALGRLSVRSTTQLSAVIDKTLYLENGPLADPGYLSRAVFMASQDNYTVSEGTHNWVITNYMDKEDFESDRLYCQTYSATPQQVRNAFNAGRIFGIYSGHGDTDYWADGPVFYAADVTGLVNANLYPFVCSFACLTGDYVDAECFCETWLLAPQKGAAAIWGSSTYSYWTEDDVLEKKLFVVLYDDYVRELGPCLNLTKLRYLEQMGSGSTTRRYFEMYNLLGDPALSIPAANAALRVIPADDVVCEGPQGGPFSPASGVYSIRNAAEYSIDYEVMLMPGADWVTLSGPVTGTLAPDATAEIVVGINNNAGGLPVGSHTATVAFTNLTDHLGDATRDVRVEVGRYVFHAGDVPKPIQDYATATSTITVDQAFCVGDLDVDVDVSHSYIGDLLITLRSPEGTLVTLHNRTGGGTANLSQRYDDDGTPPDGPGQLADFNNGMSIGDWTLTVSDQAGGDTGSLEGWSLRMLSAGAACPPQAFDDSVGTLQNTPCDIMLRGTSFLPAALTFIVTALPEHGVLNDPAGGTITSVPYALLNYGQVVRYRPDVCYDGADGLQFRVNDGRDSNIATVSIMVGGAQPAHRFPLDTNPGWSTEGLWAFGRPSGGGSHNFDPPAGHTGQNVYGYNLAGDYTDAMPVRYLTTTALDCGGLSQVELRFWRWLGVESSTWDHANVQVSRDGSNWTTVWEHAGGAVADTAWTQVSLDISAVADFQPAVYVRWGIGPTDGSVTYPGWNIDDVEIYGLGPPATIPGDLDADRDVDLTDLSRLLSLYGCAANCASDVDGDGDVDLTDLAILLSNFGLACT